MFSQLLALLLTLASLTGVRSQADWNYKDESQWSGECHTGLLQSPINIMSQDAIEDVHGTHIQGPLSLVGYEEVTVTAVNQDNSLNWVRVSGTSTPTLSGGPLSGNYSLQEIHVHWISEHAIDGMKYPLELHLLHTKSGMSLDEAVLLRDGLAVISVIGQFYSGEGSRKALSEIMPQVPYIVNSTMGHTEPVTIDVRNLISPEPQSYYTYHGSLTTPNCSEVVTWMIMDKPIQISGEQYKQLEAVDVGGLYNYRSLQPVNRLVFRSVPSSFYSESESFEDLYSSLADITSSENPDQYIN